MTMSVPLMTLSVPMIFDDLDSVFNDLVSAFDDPDGIFHNHFTTLMTIDDLGIAFDDLDDL